MGELGIGVIAPFRGLGIGKAFLQRAITEAKMRGYTRIELSVRKNNRRAIDLYKKIGFEVEGIKKRHIRIDGAYEDLLWMGLLLD